MAKYIHLAAIVCSTLACPVSAQDLPRPELNAREITAGGKLIACSLEFTAAFRDHVYKKGSIAGVTGSINLWHQNSRLYTSFKLVGVDLSNVPPDRFKVASASLFGPGNTAYKATTIDCEISSAYCAAMSPDAFLGTMTGIAELGTIRMAYNRKQGGLDVPVEPHVDGDIALQLLDCAQKLSGP